MIDHLESTGEWKIIGLSRRGGTDADRVEHIAVDLLDPSQTAAALSGLDDVTHVFYAAYQDRPTWAELVPPNLAMLVNTLDAIEPVAGGLEHVSLMQGYKVYGAHLGPFKTPARESDPPHMPPEFNVDQQQFLERRQLGKSWTWSAIRPSVVSGFALGNPMNLAMVIAVYATISKKLGVPLRFPGKPGAYTSLIEMTDAGLLAEATVWAATNPECANQAFNINNGDLFRWQEMWPKIAASSTWTSHLRSRCPSMSQWRTRSRCGMNSSRNTTLLGPRIPMSRPGGSVTSYSDGTTTFSLTDRKLGGSDFTATSTPKRCSSTSSPICRLGR